MSFWELALIAFGLSMDALAVAVCKGLASEKPSYRSCIITGLYFGIFQALMPLTGYLLAQGFSGSISAVDHWIAFVLLTVIGLKMLFDMRSPNPAHNSSFTPSVMLPLAIATSIDALTIGAGFAFLQINILHALLLIGSVTFILSALGVRLGALVGLRFRSRAELLGGMILIAMGAKILLEHLNSIS